jgi:hypothetical protein
MHRALSIALALACTPAAPALVPDWLAGPPDVRMYPDRAPLYRQVFDDVAQRCGIEAHREQLARKRLIGAVNHAVEDWRRQKRDSYRAVLRYLSVAGPDPTHCEFRLEGVRIERVLAADSESAAEPYGSSDERTPDP